MLLGLDGAACRLGVSREALTLELAQPGTPARPVDALRSGLLTRWSDEGRRDTAPGMDLVDDALDSTDLNGFVEAALRAIPDSVVDAALKTDDVLTRAITEPTCAPCSRTSTTRAT